LVTFGNVPGLPTYIDPSGGGGKFKLHFRHKKPTLRGGIGITFMSAILDSAYYPLWVMHPVMQVGLIVQLARRKWMRTYPMFFVYQVASVLTFCVLFYSKKNYDLYFYSYWIGVVVGTFLGFRVIGELFSDVLRPFHALRDFGSMLLRWAGLMVLIIAFVSAATANTSGATSRITLALLSLERSVRVMQCGLALFLLVFWRYLGISRRHPSFGIAMAFGAYAGMDLAVLGFRVAGVIGNETLNVVTMAMFNLTVVIWLAYLSQRVTERRNPEVLLQSLRWDQSLAEAAHPMEPESLMPMFDAMVDRALSRSVPEPAPEPQRDAPAEEEAGKYNSIFDLPALATIHRK